MVGGLLIGWRPTTGPAEIALAVVLLLWLRFALLWLGIFLGLHFRGPGATTAVQVLVWPIGFLSTVFVSAETMPPGSARSPSGTRVSATATAARQLFGNPTGTTTGWLAENAVVAASVWPLVITAVFLPLAARGVPALAALRLPPSLLSPHATKAGSRRARPSRRADATSWTSRAPAACRPPAAPA